MSSKTNKTMLSDSPISASFKRIKGINNLLFVSGQRGTLKLVLNGFSYVKAKEYRDTTYYRCSQWKSNCNSKVILNRTKDEILIKAVDHNHMPEYD